MNCLEFSPEEIVNLAKEIDLTNIPLPYIVKNHIVMSPGVHNGVLYSKEAIEHAYKNTDWSNPKVGLLYYEHKDEFVYNPKTGQKDLWVGADAGDWCGKVTNVRFDSKTGDLIADIYLCDEKAARAIAMGVPFGISPRGRGNKKGNVILDFIIENFGFVVNPAIKTTYFNSENQFNYGCFISLSDINEEDKMETEKINELEKKIAQLEEELKKKKEYPEPVEDKKKKEEKYPEYPEEKEKKEEHSESLTDEEISNMTPEEFASWKELVKKYGVKEATKKYRESKVKKMNEDIESLKEKIQKLEEKVLTPSVSSTVVPEKNVTISEMSGDDLDEQMLKILQSFKGIEV